MKTIQWFKYLTLSPVWGMAALLTLSGCGNSNAAASKGKSALEVVQSGMKDFKSNPTRENMLEVETAFSKLDAEISQLKADAENLQGMERSDALARADYLKDERDKAALIFARDKVSASMERAGNSIKKATDEN